MRKIHPPLGNAPAWIVGIRVWWIEVTLGTGLWAEIWMDVGLICHQCIYGTQGAWYLGGPLEEARAESTLEDRTILFLGALVKISIGPRKSAVRRLERCRGT